MVATASIKMDELLSSWLGSETIYENVMRIIEQQKETANNNRAASPTKDGAGAGASASTSTADDNNDGRPPLSPKLSDAMPKKPRLEIPPFFRKQQPTDNNSPSSSSSSSTHCP